MFISRRELKINSYLYAVLLKRASLEIRSTALSRWRREISDFGILVEQSLEMFREIATLRSHPGKIKI